MNSNTCCRNPFGVGVHTLFERQVRLTPDKTAVIAGNNHYCYSELNKRANQMAQHLHALGISPEDHVGLCAERSIDMVVALLAILKAGGAYVPIDPKYPANRIRHMVQDSGAKLIITESHIQDELLGPGIQRLDIRGNWTHTPEANTPLFNSVKTRFDSVKTKSDRLMYTIYTSGSTGKPKGVQVTHDNVVNFLRSMQQTPGISPHDKLLAITTLSFDIAVLELYLPLITGATVEIASRELAADGPQLASRLNKGDVTLMQATPATWRMLLASGWKAQPGLKALTGGEALPKDILPELLAHTDELWNMYGPTETTVWSTCYRMTDPHGPILIGQPIANTDIHVLDEQGKPVKTGEAGELYIGGEGVTRGYLNRDALTAERFVPDTFGGDPDKRLYRTGDLVKLHTDGNLEYINRLDNQVKIRGFRVDLGEIETRVAAHDSVSECVVMLREDSPGDQRLVAYYTQASTGTTTPIKDLTVSQLRAFVQQHLPEFMTPSAWVKLEDIPLTPNGKKDRNALPAPEKDRPELGHAFVAPRAPLEKYLASVWCDLLGLERVGTHDRFFELGGNSIKAIQFVERISNQIGEKIAMPGFFGAPTIAEFSTLLKSNHSEAVAQRLFEKDGAAGNHSAKPAIEKRSSEPLQNRKHTGEHEDIAIIGMACRLPGSNTIDEFWQNLHDGIESRYEVTADDLIAAGIDPSVLDDPDYVNACMPLDDVDKFDAAFFGINPREAELMDPQHRIFLECAWTALEDAGYAPQDCKVPVGVFGGVARNAYQLHNIAAYNDKRNSSGDYHILLGNDKDFLATRVAYKLNLSGPAMTIQSACSASGTALHQARLSLLNRDCDMALVGGGRIMSPHKVGYHYVDGNVLSADGHVHAFDADASGMIRGSGIVIVLLKRLSDALADNDPIRAVIKSSAVNNDGGSKASFTAPSVSGQALAIRRAMEEASISPDDISYVEAHGTGTRLGDPIEVAALAQAYKNRNKGNQYCPVGSSKTNVGHLDGGACVTGVIKTALSLQKRMIPPSLNFSKPNPLIDLANSPFYVNTALSPWETDSLPRHAAVSSFGVGGTNAHIIMKEAPPRADSSVSRPLQLLLLSGKINTSISRAAENLSQWLEMNAGANLADVAYTLQTGRSNLPLRSALVCRDREDAIEKLRALGQKVPPVQPAEEGVPLLFMFPGQGSQHLDMAKELYENEAVFKVHVDHCCRHLVPLMGMDLREVIYPSDDTNRKEATDRLKQTDIAQPALFVIEYSLAKLWISWGIQPSSMMGHSVGEYVAAYLAGVIALDDVLKVLTTRGRLMGEMPAGDMIAVALRAAELQQHLVDETSLAASNSPGISVVSGQGEAIASFRDKMAQADVQTFPLHTSHAFHSAMMEPVLAPFIKAFAGIELKPPAILFISSLTGEWITDQQATSPDYWAQQLRHAVLFSKGVNTVLKEDNPIFLEVGPGTALSASVRHHTHNGQRLQIVTSLSSAQRPEPAQNTALNALGKIWAAGIVPDWNSFYAAETRQRTALPTYPFERTRHWLEPPVNWNREDTDEYALSEVSAAGDHVANSEGASLDLAECDHPTRIRIRLKKAVHAVTGIEVDDGEESSSFLELGFDSLLLTQISARIRKDFDVLLKFQDLIEQYASIELLSAFLADCVPEEKEEAEVSVEHQEATPAPPSSTQEVTRSITEDELLATSTPPPAHSNTASLEQLLKQQMQVIEDLVGMLRGSINTQNLPSAALPQVTTNQPPATSGGRAEATTHWHRDKPPVPGAQMGRDPQGNPGWYLPDPERAGKHIRVGH